ncbi:MAG: hypothetical protein ACYC6Y_25940 [Thermoguttaceae bacterium]
MAASRAIEKGNPVAKTTKKAIIANKSPRRKPTAGKAPQKTGKTSGVVSESKRPAGVAGERAKKAGIKESAGSETEVTIDRRRSDRRTKPEAVIAERRKLERREKVTRRRQIDPTTCERDYSDEEVEFMSALDNYKRTSGRMFPTCSEILEVIRNLGYAKLPLSAVAASPSPEPSVQEPSATDLFAGANEHGGELLMAGATVASEQALA